MSDLYTGAMGMIANMMKVKTHANNIANANTNGYKYDKQSLRVFDETFARIVSKDDTRRIGQYNDMVYTDNIQTDFTQGNIKTTNNGLDFMLSDYPNQKSISFFHVSRNGQDLLTRNGNFTLDENRNLATYNGGYVLDENGNNITIPKDVQFSVDPDGTIRNSNGGAVIAKLGLTSVNNDDLGLLEKQEGGYFQVMSMNKITQNFGSIPEIMNEFDHNTTLQSVFGTKERLQDMLNTSKVRVLGTFEGEAKNYLVETSNVDMAKEMVGLMDAQRGMSAAQKVTMTMDKLLDKAANEIAK